MSFFISKLIHLLKNKNILIKLLLTFTGSSVFSVVIVALLFSNWMYRESNTNINDMTRLALSNICFTISNTFESASKAAYYLYKIPSITKLMLTGSKNRQDLLDANLHIGQFMTSNSQIYSIYICSQQSVLLTVGGNPNFSESTESILKLNIGYKNLYPVYRVIQNERGEKLQVYSFIYTERSEGSNQIPAVIVNIKVQDLYKTVFSKFLDSNEDLIIADTKGNIIMNKTMSLPMGNISSEEYYQKSNLSKNDWGNLSTKLDGKNYMINFFQFQNRKYCAFLISNHSSFFTKMKSMRNNILFICLPVLLLILLVSYYVAYKFFSPINNIFANMKRFMDTLSKDEKKNSQLNFLSNSINIILERLNSFEQDNQSHFGTIKASYLGDVFLSEKHFTQEELSKDLIKFNAVKSISDSYCITVFRIGDIKKLISNNSTSALEFQLNSIESIITEIVGSAYACSASRINNEHIILITSLWENLPKSGLSFQFKSVQETVNQLFNIELTIGSSDSFNELNVVDIREKYSHAYQLTNYRLVFGRLSIFETSDITILEVKNENISKYFDSIITSVKAGNLESYKNQLLDLFNVVKVCSYEKIVNSFFLLVQAIVQITFVLQQSEGMNTEDIYTDIKAFETYNELEMWFETLFSQTYETLLTIKANKNHINIENVITYIESNYHLNNFSANEMAQKLSVTPQYFSKLFKEQTGCNFPDYVNNIKLEKARELIISSKMTISEISEKVGYFNKPYFTSSFTKKFGVSPTKYKQVYKN